MCFIEESSQIYSGKKQENITVLIIGYGLIINSWAT